MPTIPLPSAAVSLDRADLPAEAYDDLLEIKVQDDVAAPSMFTLRMKTWDEDKLAISWADDARFALGVPVTIELGYRDATAPVISGEITGLELEMSADASPILVVRGYDRRHRLLRGTRTRSFLKTKDSDIAETIARAAGLTPQVVDSAVVLDYVLQHEQADLEFLTERAAAIGYEVVVDDKTLYFRPHDLTTEAIPLDAAQDVIDFFPRLTSRGQSGAVSVRGWDVKEKKVITGKASASQIEAMGSTGGPALADQAFGAAVTTLVDRAVSTQDEADALALGQLSTLALGFIHGEGTCVGRTDLRAGVVVEITGLGTRFSGRYYVTQVTHTYSRRAGYRTAFTVRRNAT